MAEKVVDITRAREQKELELKDERLEKLKERFSRAMGMDDKPKKKLSAWQRRKQKAKPKPDGW